MLKDAARWTFIMQQAMYKKRRMVCDAGPMLRANSPKSNHTATHDRTAYLVQETAKQGAIRRATEAEVREAQIKCLEAQNAQEKADKALETAATRRDNDKAHKEAQSRGYIWKGGR